MSQTLTKPSIRLVVNDCYILQKEIFSDYYSEYWLATAIFSANKFLLRFIKCDKVSEESLINFYKQGLLSLPIRHDAVLSCLEIDKWKDFFYTASDYSGINNLSDLLNKGLRLPLEQISVLSVELLKALHSFHSRNLIYKLLNTNSIWLKISADIIREIKLINPGDGELYFTDNPPGIETIQEQNDFILENTAYLAPELKGAGHYPIDQKADLYSLGIIIYRLLTGKLPFSGNKNNKIRNKAVSVVHVAFSLRKHNVPESAIKILVKMLRKNPKLRYRDTAQASLDWTSLMNGFVKKQVEKKEFWEKLLRINEKPTPEDVEKGLASFNIFEVSDSDNDPPMSSELFPTQGNFSDLPESWEEQLEELYPDDDRMTEDEIITIAAQEETLFNRSKLIPVNPIPDVQKVLEPTPVEVIEIKHEQPKAIEEKGKTNEIRSEPEITEIQEAPIELNVKIPLSPIIPEKRIKEKKPSTLVPLYSDFPWFFSYAKEEDAAKAMREDWKRATAKKGSVRFIQKESEKDYPLIRLFMNEIKSKSLYIKLMDLDSDLTKQEVLKLFSLTLGNSIISQSQAYKRSLLSRMKKKYFGQKDLLRLEALISLGELEPDGKPWDFTTKESLDFLTALGTRRFPLVLELQGAERVTPLIQDLILNLRANADGSHFCIFAFFETSDVPAWHVLSEIPHNKDFPKDTEVTLNNSAKV